MTGPVVPSGGEDELPPYMLANTGAEFDRVRDAASRRLRAEAEQIARGPGDEDELREALAAEAACHGILIGVDQRFVLCTCGWRDHDEANLSRPLGKWKLHVADALLPVVLADRERHARQRAAEELRAAASEAEERERLGLGGCPASRFRDRADALTREATT